MEAQAEVPVLPSPPTQEGTVDELDLSKGKETSTAQKDEAIQVGILSITSNFYLIF